MKYIIRFNEIIGNMLRLFKNSKKLKNGFGFTTNYYIFKIFNINFIKQIETKKNIKYNITDIGEVNNIVEYCNNYYNIEELENKQGNIMIDIGANSGDFSILLHKNYKKIYALEPIDFVYDKFNKNIKINNIKNIKALNYGISHINTNANITINKKSITSSRVTEQGEHSIKLISWSELYKRMGNPKKIDLLKIDCEGSEYTLLKDPKILNYVKEIRMEFHIYSEKEVKQYLKLMKLLYSKKFELTYSDKFDLSEIKNKKNITYEMHFIKLT